MAPSTCALAGHSMGQDTGASSLAGTGSLMATMSQPGYTGSVPLRATLSSSRRPRKRKGSRVAPSPEALGLLSQAEGSHGHAQSDMSVRVGRSISHNEELWEWEEALESLTVSRVENWLTLVAKDELTSRSPASLLHPHFSRRARRARLHPHTERILSPFLAPSQRKSDETEGPPTPRAAPKAEAEPLLDSVDERDAVAVVSAEASALSVHSARPSAEAQADVDSSTALLPPTEAQQAVQAAEPYKYLLLSMAIFATPASVCFAGVVLCPLLAVPAILAWFVAETVFIPLRSIQLRWASRELIEHPVPEAHEQKELFERVLQLRHHGIKPDQFLSRWFHGTPITNLSRDDVTNFLSCSFYHRQYAALPPHIQAAVREKVDRLEDVLEMKFRRDEEEVTPPSKGILGWLGSWFQRKPKKAAPMPFMAHTMEPLKAVVHPLAVYAWGHWVGHLTVSAMSSMGFTQHTSKTTGFKYFILRRNSVPSAQQARGSAGEGAEEVPADEVCIFIHGLGVGITPYLVFVHQLLATSPHKTIVVLELPHLAFRLCSEIPSVERLVEGVDEVLDVACPGGQASIIGHSYGSLVAAHFVRTRPDKVASLGLIDPVSILLCLPDVVYNFIYKPPESVEDLIRSIMVSKELNVAQALCRVFNWHSLLLWAHQMPEQSVVMLSGKDSIVPSPEVRSYLDAHHIPVIYNENLKHAEFLVCPDLQKRFLDMLYQPKAARAATLAPVPV